MVFQLINVALLAGYYTILATGLAFMYSVMRVINLAHGTIIVFSAYGLWILGSKLNIQLYISIPVMILVMFLLGMVLYRTVLSNAIQSGELLPILATFGIAIILDNLMFQVFGADNLSLAPFVDDLSWASFELPGGIFVGKLNLYILLVAVVLIAGLDLLLSFTVLGRQIRAVSQDKATSAILGIDTERIASVATGIALATGVIAATAMGLRSSWGPYSGTLQLLFAFEAVVIGGTGSLWRVVAGSVILALAQSVGAFIHPQGFQLGGHLAFLIAVFIRISGYHWKN